MKKGEMCADAVNFLKLYAICHNQYYMVYMTTWYMKKYAFVNNFGYPKFDILNPNILSIFLFCRHKSFGEKININIFKTL